MGVISCLGFPQLLRPWEPFILNITGCAVVSLSRCPEFGFQSTTTARALCSSRVLAAWGPLSWDFVLAVLVMNSRPLAPALATSGKLYPGPPLARVHSFLPRRLIQQSEFLFITLAERIMIPHLSNILNT